MLDQVDLVNWLRDWPAVALMVMRDILKNGFASLGLEPITDFLSAYRRAEVPTAVLLAGRTAVAERFRNLDHCIGETIRVQADSADEAAAFVCAALLDNSEEDILAARRGACIVVRSKTAALQLFAANGLTLILTNDANDEQGRLSANNRVIVADAFDMSAYASEKSALTRPTAVDFVRALTDGGVEYAEAQALSTKSGRSLTVLRRQNPHTRKQLPDWAKLETKERDYVRASLLVGSWHQAHALDHSVIERLSGRRPPCLREEA